MGARHEQRARGDLARAETPPVWGTTPILIGDHIENAGNAGCLRAAAAMFDWPCGFIGDSGGDAGIGADGAWRLHGDVLARSGVPIIAVENANGAEDLFKYRRPDGPFALVVGNERKGVSRELLRLADRVVQIPMRSVQLNCLNVAAAAAVALYRLARPAGRIVTRGRGRPTIVLAGVDDAIELGSAIRTAACLGWRDVMVDDRHGVWFDADRVTRSLGRGAARRARNSIRVLPLATAPMFDEVCLVSTDEGEPLRCADLALGPRQLVVLGDADAIDVTRLAPRVRAIHLDIDRGPFRLVASIALAEIARQVG
jgi:SpoU rRNA Methylase family